MNFKRRNICIFLFILVIFLGLSTISASDVTDSSNSMDDSQVASDIQDTYNDNSYKENILNNKTTDKNVKTETKNVKTASKTPVSYNIIITNNLVDNTTFDIGVIDYKTEKAIPSSNLKIKLPNSTVVNAKTGSNGYASVSVKVPSGNNTLNIAYAGTDKYYDYDYNLVLEVFKRNVNMTVNMVKEESGRTNISLQLSDRTNNQAISNANLNIKASNGQTFNVKTNKNGAVNATLNLNAGDNQVNITYDGDYKYNPAKSVTNINVPTPKKIVNYNVTLNNLYVGNTSITLKVYDYNTTKPLANANIKFKVLNSKTYTGKTNSNGLITFKVDETVGKHYANITYDGNATYHNRTETINFTVLKRVSDMNYTVINSSGNHKLNITLKDLVLNKTIQNADVTVILPNNTKVTRKTDANGRISVDIPHDIENQTYKLTYNGNANVTGINKTINVYVPQPKVPVNVNVTVASNIYQNDSIIFTLTDQKTNKTIPNAKLAIKINNKDNIITTNKTGQAQIQSNLTVGTNNIQISYNGTDRYQNFTTVVPINIIKRPTNMTSNIILGSNVTLNLTLKDLITNKPLKNVDVSVIHPQKTIQLKTNNNGQIYTKLDLPAGKTKLIIRYLGNSTQQAVNSTTSAFTIPGKTNNKTNTITAVNDTRVSVGDNVTITAYVLDLDDKKVNTGYVTFKINGTLLKDVKTNQTNIPVKDSLAKITINTPYNWRNSNIKVETQYLENSKYNPSVTKSNLAVALRTAVMTVTTSPSTTKMDNKITLTTTLKDNITINDGVVIFKINGLTLKDENNKTYEIRVKNNTATLTYTIPDGWSAKSFKVTSVYSNKNYKRIENKTYFNLTKTNTHFNVTSIQAKVNSNVNIKAKLLDEHNHNVLGVNTIAVKINGQTLKDKNNKSMFFNIVNGTINISFKLPDMYNKAGNYTIMFVTGDRNAYLGSRYTTTLSVKN